MKALRRLFISIILLVLSTATFVWLHLPDAQPPRYPDRTIDDVSTMHPTIVDSVFAVSTEDDIINAITYARDNKLRVSIAGRRHSMGGHTLTPNGVTLLMTGFNKVLSFDSITNSVTVQSGITWDTLQVFLNVHAKAVMSMQGPNIFTVGGSMSVNAHGWAKFNEQVGESIASFRLVLANGSTLQCTPNENAELFHLVIGGMGLFGVITEVTLRVVPNDLLTSCHRIMDIGEIEHHFRLEYEPNSSCYFFHADLSIAPSSFLQEGVFSVFCRSEEDSAGVTSPILEETHVARDRFFLQLSRQYNWGKELRWWLQKKLVRSTTLSRNNTMHSPYKRLEYYSPENVDILQEYFVPAGRVASFAKQLRSIIQASGANLINCTIRSIRKSEVPFLNYARHDGFGFVLYFNVAKDSLGRRADSILTDQLVEASLADSGTFYLPYLPYYSASQLRRAYPDIDIFMEKKLVYDPNQLFSSIYYERLKSILH